METTGAGLLVRAGKFTFQINFQPSTPMKTKFFFPLALVATLLSACSEQKPIQESNQPVSTKTETIIDSARQHEVQQAKGAEAGTVYECPMACEGSRSAQPGKCPVCGMDLEKKG